MARLRLEDRDRGAWALFSDEDAAGGEGAPAAGDGAPRVAVIAGGRAPDETRLHRETGRAQALVCADGGLRTAWAAGLVPDLVSGDLDSLPGWARDRLPPETFAEEGSGDESDLEKAVREVFRRWGAAAEVTLLGAGSAPHRTDHALANLGVLLAEPHRRIQWVDEDGRMVALRSGRLEIEDLVGSVLSIMPWSLHGAVVSAVGAHYPLDEERLYLGGRGMSNEIGDEIATVEVHEGVVLIWVGC